MDTDQESLEPCSLIRYWLKIMTDTVDSTLFVGHQFLLIFVITRKLCSTNNKLYADVGKTLNINVHIHVSLTLFAKINLSKVSDTCTF